MSLDYLDIGQTPVVDLSPVRGLPIGYLKMAPSEARDFEVLKSLEKLNRVDCDLKTPGLAAVLRQIKTLQTVNDQPAADALK